MTYKKHDVFEDIYSDYDGTTCSQYFTKLGDEWVCRTTLKEVKNAINQDIKDNPPVENLKKLFRL